MVEDVKLVDRCMVRQWSSSFLQVSEVHLWGGFPCTDLSAVKFNGDNLRGRNSMLFCEVPRIRDLLQEEFGVSVKVKTAVENVPSMDDRPVKKSQKHLRQYLNRLDPVHTIPMRRPRYVWLPESLEGTFPDVCIETKKYWRDEIAEAPGPSTEQWLEPGHDWAGGHHRAVFPTCMKAIPAERPPPQPAGFAKCSALTLKRWREDSFRYPV